MALYEVKVKQTSTVYYEVEAKTADEAAEKFARDNFMCEFVEEEEVVGVTNYDDRFDDDEAELTDEYEREQEETDE